MGGNLFLIVLITLKLTPELQGFYYTFNSLIALQFFAELGLGTAVVVTISHAQTKLLKYSYAHFYKKWYLIASILFFALTVPAIYVFNERIILLDSYQSKILVPWFIVCFGTALNLYLNGKLSIYEGLGFIKDVSQVRVIQTSVSVCTAMIVLLMGGGLYALGAGSVMKYCLGVLLSRKLTSKSNVDYSNLAKVNVNWRSDIFPFQWRIAVSWIAGYFIFYFFTPLLMFFHGPVIAGRFGMSVQLFQAISSISNVWITTNLPVLSRLIADMRFSGMELLFKKCVRLSLMSFVVSSISVFSLLYVLYIYDIELRLVDNKSLVLLAFAALANHAFFILNYYSRIFKKEILHGISLLNALSTLCFCLLVVPSKGAFGAAAVYAFNALALSFFAASIVTYKFRNNQKVKLTKSADN